MRKKYQGKKKHFIRFFLWRFLICLPVFSVLGMLTFVVPFADEIWGQESFYNERIEKSLQKTDNAGGSVKDYINTIPEYLATLSSSYQPKENAWILYQPETGVYYTGETYAVAYIWQNGSRQVCKLNDQYLINRLDSSMNLYYPYDLIVYSIYVKDGQFVPGEVYMQKRSSFPYVSRWKEGRIIRGEWVDLSSGLAEGWTKVCSDRSKEYLSSYHDYCIGDAEADDNARKLSADGKIHLGSVFCVGSPNSPQADTVTAEMKVQLPLEFEKSRHYLEEELDKAEHGMIPAKKLIYNNTLTRSEYIDELRDARTRELRKVPEKAFSAIQSRNIKDYKDSILLPDKRYHTTSERITFRGEEWILFHFAYLNAWDWFCCNYLFYFPLLLIYLLPIILIAALIWAVICYLIYRRRYDIEAYRRNLTGALAHDLKTPLAVIYGHAENIRAHTHPESTDDYADCIMENVTHIDEMIAGVLGLAKLENKAAPKMRDTIDLTALLHEAFRRCAPQMEARELTLKESGKLAFRGNAEMLQQLAENLVSNAVQHTAEGGEIAVTAEKRTLCISNPYTGELDEKTLCEPFRRGDTARGSDSGSGLGLSIVQQIAALHKIRLRVTARNGIFTVRLKVRSPRRKMN